MRSDCSSRKRVKQKKVTGIGEEKEKEVSEETSE